MVSTLFIQRQLNYVQNEVVRQDFPEYMMASGALVDISTEIPAGAKTYTYKILTFVGEAAIAADGADDIPLVNAYAEERMGRVRTIVDGYQYTIDDMEAAALTNMNVDAEMGTGARQVIEAKFDQLAYDGDSNFNLLGMLNQPNVPTYTVLNDGTGTSTTWASKTPEKIYRDLQEFVAETMVDTNSVESIEAIGLPVAQFSQIAGTPYPTASAAGDTILSFFLRVQRLIPGGVQTVVPIPNLAGKGVGGTDLMVGYRKRPDKIRLHMPLDFEMQPVQVRNFTYRVPCRMKTGGIQLMKPFSMRYASGI